MIKAVVFDFDGTLADTLPAIREGVNMAMRKLGYPEHDLDAIRSFINHGARHLIRCALPKDLQNDEVALDAALNVFQSCYEQTCLQTEETYDGMKELVQRLHGDYKIGILSNKPDAFLQALCAQVLEEGSFDAAQGGLSDHPTKPNPYLTEKIAEAMGVETAECLMIGDSDVDYLTAQNANMEHIGVTWGFRDEAFLRQHGVARIAHTVEELEMLIKSLS